MKKRTERFIVSIILALCFFTEGICCYAGWFHKNEWEKDNVMNILVLGEDKDSTESMNEKGNGNADGQIIVSINNDTKKIVLSSLARDSFLHVDGEQGTKATLIYHYLGKEALCEAIESNLGIHIDNTVIFNYYSIIDVVDALGGVDLELNETEIYFTNEKIKQMNTYLLDMSSDDGLLENSPGMMHLNGKQAACYMRIRISDDTNNDFGRTNRARKVILALKDEAMKAKKKDLIAVAKKVIPNVDFDFSLKELLELVGDVLNFKDYEMVSQCIPVEGTYTTSEGYVYMNYEENKKVLNESINN